MDVCVGTLVEAARQSGFSLQAQRPFATATDAAGSSSHDTSASNHQTSRSSGSGGSKASALGTGGARDSECLRDLQAVPPFLGFPCAYKYDGMFFLLVQAVEFTKE